MRTAYWSKGRALQILGVVAISAVAAACADTPVRPTREQTPVAAGYPSAVTLTAPQGVTTDLRRAPVDLAGCLKGDSDPSCFDAHAFRAAAVVASPATAPGAPGNFACTVSGSTVDFTWLPSVGGDPVETYRLQAGSAPGLFNYADFMTLSTANRYTAHDVFPGTYYVRVLAMSGGATSPASNEVMIVVGAGAGCFPSTGTPPPAPTCASAPRTLTNTSQGTGNISFTWSAPDSGTVTTYNIQAGSAPGLADLANFDTGSSALSYAAGNVPAGSYYLRVYARSSCGLSSASNEVLIVLSAAPTPGSCASAPRSLLNASQSAGTISLTWSAPASGVPTSYVIVAGSAPGRSDLVAGSDTGSTATSYVATGVPAGSYYVRVYSRSSCGLSSASNEVLVYVVGFTSDVQVSVSWDSPTDVDLHVVDPSGEEVYWAHTTSSSGGQLDVDSNAGCSIDGRQIENIRWSSRAPAGTYTVRVDYWSSCSVALTNYLVTVKNGGSTQTYSGNFTGSGDGGGAGSGRLITTFVHAASLSLEPVLDLIRPPALSVPSAEKLRRSR